MVGPGGGGGATFPAEAALLALGLEEEEELDREAGLKSFPLWLNRPPLLVYPLSFFGELLLESPMEKPPNPPLADAAVLPVEEAGWGVGAEAGPAIGFNRAPGGGWG
jgi:hypothetical protein